MDWGMSMRTKCWSGVASEVVSLARGGGEDATIMGVEYDSRRVVAGSVFVAMRGGSTDGNRFVDGAIAQGAVAIVTDSAEVFSALGASGDGMPRLLVENGRTALAEASAAFFGHPERRLASTGVTGTNGKTTTAFLTEDLLRRADRTTVLVGTIEYHVAGSVRPSPHTTPESRDLFALMAEGAESLASELVMEVSSHALDQGRVTGVGFDVAVFTNLTQDHLDYHGTMEAYFGAKKLLFDGRRYTAPRVAVLNAEDAASPALAEAARSAGAEVIFYGLGRGDWRAEHLELTPGGAEFTLASPLGTARVSSRLAGEVNVLNLLAALAAAGARGVEWASLMESIGLLTPVTGRFQPVDAGQPFMVIVDYAHTEDALRNLTRLARGMAHGGQVITLFGCGGDRDRTKRPRMGQAAGEGSDFVVLTSDNPRSEDPAAILNDILPGLAGTGKDFFVEADRAKAIAIAVGAARAGDVVLVAGKGHETEQILREGAIPFDDAEVAHCALRGLGYGGGL